MGHGHGSYLAATRHPLSCLMFLLPLMLAYEGGVLSMGGARPELLRNGADTWLRWGLETTGLPQAYGAPALILGIFLSWSWLRRDDRPEGVVPVCLGMAFESIGFALGLWGLSRQLGPWLDQLGIRLATGPAGSQAVQQVVTFVGAGIYEELIFRLLLCAALALFFQLLGMSRFLAMLMVAAASALIFSAAHHVGPYGEVFNRYIFVFRAVAGLYFAILYQLRGFGVAVGTHASYDVIVGVLMR